MNMRFAISRNLRIEPQPGAVGRCQICGNEVKAYCGEINVWHWRHKKILDCDTFYEPMSEWHKNWQNMFPEDWREVPLVKNNKTHFADIYTSKGLTLEFQNSSISKQEILERELFYDNIIWVVNAINFKDNITLTYLYDERINELKEKYNRVHFTDNISKQLDYEIDNLKQDFLNLDGKKNRKPRILKSKTESLANHKRILENIDDYILNEAFPIWLKKGRIGSVYDEILKMNEVEIRQKVIDLELTSEDIVEHLKNKHNSRNHVDVDKKTSTQEIYQIVKSYFLEGLPKLIKTELSDIQKLEHEIPIIHDEIISTNLAIEQIESDKEKKIADIRTQRDSAHKKEQQRIKEKYENIFSFKWSRERKSWKFSNKPIFLDLGNEYLFEIKSKDQLKRISKTDFITHYSRE